MTPTSHFNTDLFDAISTVITKSEPYGLQCECLAEFINDIADIREHVDFTQAATDALYEWDI